LTPDLASILRVVGTFNYKDQSDPKTVSIIQKNENRYSRDDFAQGLPANIKHIEKEKGHVDSLKGLPEGERDNEIFRFACSRIGRGYKQNEVLALVKKKASNCDPPFPEKEAIKCFKSAQKIAGKIQFMNNNKFTPSKLVEYILMFNDIFHDGSVFYRYDNRGVWVEMHDDEIGQEMDTALGHRSRSSYVHDTMKVLEYRRFVKEQKLKKIFKLINLKNGMLNPKTGKLLQHKKEYYSKNQLPIE
jgi:hypothetical protein